jgi:hypothetical protein
MKKERQVKTEYGTVSLPLPLIDKVKKKIEGTGMSSVSSYVSFVLRQVLSSSDNTGKIMDVKTQEDVKARLKDLGYI